MRKSLNRRQGFAHFLIPVNTIYCNMGFLREVLNGVINERRLDISKFEKCTMVYIQFIIFDTQLIVIAINNKVKKKKM